MPIDLFPRSRFQLSEPVIVDGVETYGKWKQPSFLTTELDPGNIALFQVTNAFQGRPDLIAYNVYGDPFLDWVLIAFNKPQDVLNWPRAGDVIRYPVATVVIPQLV